jgi:hypothetical protein
MNRVLTCGALSAALLAGAPAFAQSSSSTGMGKMDCTESDMKKVNAEMMKMSSGDKKQMAMKEMDMAESMMKKGNMKDCMMHMEKAMGMMK